MTDYDNQGQLTDDGENTYAYGPAGNRDDLTIDDDNRVASDGTWNYTYDLEGNITGKDKIGSDEKWVYGYDNVNHLIHVEHYDASDALVMESDYGTWM